MALFEPSRRKLLGGLACGLVAPALLRSPAVAAGEPLRFEHAFGITVVPRPA